jgi:hypothetical protein
MTLTVMGGGSLGQSARRLLIEGAAPPLDAFL